jgi:PIN domain nuclease of toxin-antitoxin system
VNLLLDTHALIWAVDSPHKIGSEAARLLKDSQNELVVSVCSIWEIAIKLRIGKLKIDSPFRDWIIRALADLGAIVLPIKLEHCTSEMQLPEVHRDPFDRLLAAQSIVEKWPLVSIDENLDTFGIHRIWN